MSDRARQRFYSEVGKKIRQARLNRDTSQQKLADSIGFSRVSIVNIEGGRQRPPLHVLCDIADVLGVPVAALLPDKAPAQSIEAEIPEELRDYAERILKGGSRGRTEGGDGNTRRNTRSSKKDPQRRRSKAPTSRR